MQSPGDSPGRRHFCAVCLPVPELVVAIDAEAYGDHQQEDGENPLSSQCFLPFPCESHQSQTQNYITWILLCESVLKSCSPWRAREESWRNGTHPGGSGPRRSFYAASSSAAHAADAASCSPAGSSPPIPAPPAG